MIALVKEADTMKTLTDQLANYAAYHRDTRNILTHLFGIPMIVLAVAVLLSPPAAASCWMKSSLSSSRRSLSLLPRVAPTQRQREKSMWRNALPHATSRSRRWNG